VGVETDSIENCALAGRKLRLLQPSSSGKEEKKRGFEDEDPRECQNVQNIRGANPDKEDRWRGNFHKEGGEITKKGGRF